jgi:hypothetical protein
MISMALFKQFIIKTIMTKFHPGLASSTVVLGLYWHNSQPHQRVSHESVLTPVKRCMSEDATENDIHQTVRPEGWSWLALQEQLKRLLSTVVVQWVEGWLCKYECLSLNPRIHDWVHVCKCCQWGGKRRQENREPPWRAGVAETNKQPHVRQDEGWDIAGRKKSYIRM